MRRSVLEREKDSVASLVHATQELQNTSTSGTRLPQGAKWELPPEVGAREQFPSAHVQVFALVLLYSILWVGKMYDPRRSKTTSVQTQARKRARPTSSSRRGGRTSPAVLSAWHWAGLMVPQTALGSPTLLALP